MTRALNLLHHPGQARQRQVFHRWWSGLAGLLAGTALAWSGQQWQALDTERLQQAQRQLQTAWDARTQQAQKNAREQSRRRLQAEQLAHLQHIAEHQAAWMALHTALQQAAEDQGLRLKSLQAEGDKIELQGTMARFDAMRDARQSLSEQLGRTWDLTSTTVGPGQALGFVWQAAWPSAHAVSPARTTGRAPAP